MPLFDLHCKRPNIRYMIGCNPLIKSTKHPKNTPKNTFGLQLNKSGPIPIKTVQLKDVLYSYLIDIFGVNPEAGLFNY